MSPQREAATAAEGPPVLVLSQYYRPETNFITADVAEMLARSCRVTVVTAHPNYPSGRFFAGTRWWWPSKRVENGVTVWRLPMIPDHSRSVVLRLLSYLSFTCMALLFAPFVAGRAKLVWVYHTPFTLVLAALWFKLVFRARLALTVVDLWPESFSASGVTSAGWVMSVAHWYRRFVNGLADEIICSTRGTSETFACEGVARQRLSYVPVWVEGIPAPEHLPAAPAAQRNVIVYAGNIGPAQNLEPVVRGAALLQQRNVPVEVHLYGSGSDEPRLRRLSEELGLRQLVFKGRVSPDAAFAACASSLGQIIALRSTALFRMTIPSKLGSCLAAGAPILAGMEGEALEVALASGGAVAYEASAPESFAAAVEKLVGWSDAERLEVRRKLRAFYLANFERSRLLEEYERILLGRRDVAGVIPLRPAGDAEGVASDDRRGSGAAGGAR